MRPWANLGHYPQSPLPGNKGADNTCLFQPQAEMCCGSRKSDLEGVVTFANLQGLGLALAQEALFAVQIRGYQPASGTVWKRTREAEAEGQRRYLGCASP